ncbi:MAG: hypothetical protein M9961_01720 [Ilumatobacteraceae bacterium]|nr:hypothetical protein [Ilumatobacter sp.]MCO5328781.1 hypothetical protein [Ilumatobacteraceae bacterium]
MRHQQRPLRLAVLLLAALLPAACGGGGESASTTGATPAGSGTPDDTGGAAAAMSIASDDGLLTLDVPAGAVPAGTEITVTRMDAADGTYEYDLQPDGLQFATPAAATFDASDLLFDGPAVWAATLTSADGTDEPLLLEPGDSGTFLASVPHFSRLGITVNTDLPPSVSGDVTSSTVATVTGQVGEETTIPPIADPTFELGKVFSIGVVFDWVHNFDTVRCLKPGEDKIAFMGRFLEGDVVETTRSWVLVVELTCVEAPTEQPVTLGDAWGADLKLEGAPTFEIVDGNVVFSFGPDVTGLATAGTVGLQTPLVGGGYFNCYAPYDENGIAEMPAFEPGRGGCELLSPDYSVKDRFPIDVTLDEGVLSMSVPYGPGINGTTPDLFFAGAEGEVRRAAAESSIEWLLRVFGPTYVTFYANDGSGFRASAQIDPLPSYLCPLATDDSPLAQGCAGG